MSQVKDTLKKIKSIYLVTQGFAALKFKKKTPASAYKAMRHLFVATNGRSNDFISSLISKSGYADLDFSGVLNFKNKADVKEAVDGIKENGFYIFKEKLPEELINSITNFAVNTPCIAIRVGSTGRKNKYTEVPELFDENNPISPKYKFTQQQIVENEHLQKLIFDNSILTIAQEYLQTKPILDMLTMWWSAPFQGLGKSEAAQLYHFDMDRLKFIKFFFYLTDVDAQTGPHCYVKASHKRLPKSLQKDGRLTDEEVRDAYGEQNLLELYGKKGTIMAVDTRGLHKGKELTKGKRLLFQIEFANSMFGQYYPPVKKPAFPKNIEEKYNKYKYTFGHFIG